MKKTIAIFLIVLVLLVSAACGGNMISTENVLLQTTAPNEISIKGISYTTDLTELHLRSQGLTNEDIEPLKHMIYLASLDLALNEISDINVLNEMPNLTGLNLSGNQISNISVLGELANLVILDLSGNEISDISALRGLTNLKALTISDNQINDISVLGELTSLLSLRLSGNSISDEQIAELQALLPNCIIDNQTEDIQPGIPSEESTYHREELSLSETLGGIIIETIDKVQDAQITISLSAEPVHAIVELVINDDYNLSDLEIQTIKTIVNYSHINLNGEGVEINEEDILIVVRR